MPASVILRAFRRFPAVVASLLLAMTGFAAHEPASPLRVMTFNLWHGGDAGGRPLSQTIEVIRAAQADIAGFQETAGHRKDGVVPDRGAQLAKTLGWHYFDQGRRCGIASRHPIVANTPDRHGAQIQLPSGDRVWMFNVHFAHAPYQPYQLLDIPYEGGAFLSTAGQAVEAAMMARGAQVRSLLEEMRTPLLSRAPVFLTGDFNEPSHQDWTPASVQAGLCPLPVSWPATKAVVAAGLIDSFRSAHPDETKARGLTWTSITLEDDPKDRHDRIDFVFFTGERVKLVDSKVVGEKAGRADIVVTPYPSDHRAVISTFELAAPPASSRTVAAAPYPASAVIRQIVWAPTNTIIRKARGSDNWPITWADDDQLYTAYGDGFGFEPLLSKKLSLGFVRVTGTPPDFSGTNIRSPSGERLGDGARGQKASGMLMVDGVLYMWVRNSGNAQLAWSEDRGETWTWNDWKWTTSFGAPTFLNFGRNYEGARDRFVYTYSHDSDSAYTGADRMILARVPKEQIRRRDAYEFFKALNAEGHPVWTPAIEERGSVFSHANKCYRSGISYNPGLKRYLWCQILAGADTRFQGGFAIYDAPEPWGPWTTVYYTEQWDVGPGETSSFPTKWMSPDGKTLHLVFSGDDYFSVRQAALRLLPSEGEASTR